jgi:hypothetical protein
MLSTLAGKGLTFYHSEAVFYTQLSCVRNTPFGS